MHLLFCKNCNTFLVRIFSPRIRTICDQSYVPLAGVSLSTHLVFPQRRWSVGASGNQYAFFVFQGAKKIKIPLLLFVLVFFLFFLFFCLVYIPLPFWVTLMSNLNCHFDNLFLKTHFQKIWTSEEGDGVGKWRQGALGLQPTREGNTCRDAALICENLRVGGFKLNINIKKKNEVWAGCHCTEEA